MSLYCFRACYANVYVIAESIEEARVVAGAAARSGHLPWIDLEDPSVISVKEKAAWIDFTD